MENLPPRPIKVLIVDDRSAFRRRLRQLLELAGWSVVGEAGDIPTAEELVQNLRPDVALVDVFLPGVNGFDGAVRLKASMKSLRVYLISSYANQTHQVETLARSSGAEAFVLKDDLNLELIRTWTQALAEGLYEGT